MADPTKKPIPTTLREWAAEVEGIRKFISAVEKDNLGNSDSWVAKMKNYYVSRHDYLLDNCPVERYHKVKTARKRR